MGGTCAVLEKWRGVARPDVKTMKAPAQTRRPLLSGGYEQHRLTSYGVGHVSNRIVLRDEKWMCAKHFGKMCATPAAFR
jgi:hypothetical protein